MVFKYEIECQFCKARQLAKEVAKLLRDKIRAELYDLAKDVEGGKNNVQIKFKPSILCTILEARYLADILQTVKPPKICVLFK